MCTKNHKPYIVKWTPAKVLAQFNEILDYIIANPNEHGYIKYLIDNKIDPDVVATYSKKYSDNKDISRVYRTIKTTLENRVIQKGLDKSWDSQIVRLIMQTHYGYSQKTEQKIEVNDTDFKFKFGDEE